MWLFQKLTSGALRPIPIPTVNLLLRLSVAVENLTIQFTTRTGDIMAKLQDVKDAQSRETADIAKLAADLQAAVATVKAQGDALNQQIADLIAKNNSSGGSVTEADLQGLADTSSANADAIEAADAALTAAVAGLTPPPTV